jgi:hypothetical protein
VAGLDLIILIPLADGSLIKGGAAALTALA